VSGEEDDLTLVSLADQFPDWEAWVGIEGLWHARIVGATPPVMVRGESLDDLRDEIRKYLDKAAAYWAGQ
jgi:hypothetical protein